MVGVDLQVLMHELHVAWKRIINHMFRRKAMHRVEPKLDKEWFILCHSEINAPIVDHTYAGELASEREMMALNYFESAFDKLL